MHFVVSLPTSSDPFALLLMAFLFGFIPGAIPFGFFAGRFRGIDLRRHGSGNIGFTNVARVMGWPYAVPVLILDLAKGLLPVVFTPILIPKLFDNPSQILAMQNLFGVHWEPLCVIVGLSAILGHVFTPILKFKGGKGIATTAGVVLALTPRTFAVCLGVFLLVLLTTRYLSLASIAAAICLPVAAYLFQPLAWSIFAFALLVAMLLLTRHIANIKRLLAHTEPHFTLKPKAGRK